MLRGVKLTDWTPVHISVSTPEDPGWTRFSVDGDAQNPRFEFPFSLHAGWFILEFSIRRNREDVAKLYFDVGNGFNDADSISLTYRNHTVQKRFFRIPNRCVGLRFVPVHGCGEFAVGHFKLRRVPKRFALKRIQAKLQGNGRGKVFVNSEQAYHSMFETGGVSDYPAYIAEVEPDLITGQLAPTRLVISVLMPVYNPEPLFLQQAIESVRAQTYPYWQLCIADDHSSNGEVIRVLEEYAALDSRIKVTFRDENGHISAAGNSALSLCTGDFVALMDHDDVLPPHALNEMAHIIAKNPDVQIIYSDEDKLNLDGGRVHPHFKSDWNLDLLYSQNYISHLGVYRRSLLVEVGGFRPGVEGAQDYDLLLRCVHACGGKGIEHIPMVLYHWRVGTGSTALGADEKTYTTDAGIRALRDVLGNAVEDVTQGRFPNTYRVRWKLPEELPLVSLIMPTRNGTEMTRRAIDSILEKTDYPKYEILLVDNHSDDPQALEYFAALAEQREGMGKVRVLRYPGAFNFSDINNVAVSHATGAVLGFVNNDIEVINDDWLGEMVSHVVRKDVGCVGAKLYYPDGRLQHAGVVLGILGVAEHSHKLLDGSLPGYFGRAHLVQNYSAVTAACMLVRREVFDMVGGFDAENLTIAFNDVDFCLKVRDAGYRNVWTPYAELYHYESLSRGADDTAAKKKRLKQEAITMHERWKDALQNDPCYNRNLTLENASFSIYSKSDRFR